MADLADILGTFVSNPIRIRLMNDVFALLDGDAVLAGNGGVFGLLGPSIAMPSADGVDEHGGDVESIVMGLDQDERYAGVATPARTALSLYDAHIEWSPGIQDLEDEHGRDAVIRLVGLGLVAEGMCDGGSDDAASAWLETESGRACLVWFSVVEVVLAYSTEDDPIDGDKLLDILDTFFDDAIDEWSELASDTGLARARIIVNNWTDVLCPAITAAAGRVDDIARVVRNALGDGGDVDGLAAEAKSIALYRSLVVRHIGEVLHGSPEGVPVAIAESTDAVRTDEAVSVASNEQDTVDETGRAADDNERHRSEENLTILRGALDELNQSLFSARDLQQRTSEHLDSIGEALASTADQRTSVSTELAALQTSQPKRLESVGNGTVKATFARAQKELRTATSVWTSATETEATIRTSLKEVESTLRSSRADARKTTRHCLRSVDEHRRLCVQRVALLRDAAQITVQQLGGVRRQAEEVHTARTRIKNAVSELRKERRRVGRATATTSREEGSLQKRLDDRMAMVDASRLAAREARDTVKLRRVSHKASETTLVKRVERVQDVQARQRTAESKVDDISHAISALRDELRGLMHEVEARRAEEKAERQAHLVGVRKRRQAAESVLTEGHTRLPRLKETSKAMRAGITELIAQERDALAARDAALKQLQQLQQQREDEGNRRQNQAELAVAALEMLKANAKRLEESHSGYRDAQAALDRFFKEQNLAESQKESLDRDIAMAHVAQDRAVAHIETTKAAVAQTKLDIERIALDIERAKQAVKQERKDRIKALDAQRMATASHIAAMKQTRMEAEEDHRGLAKAEQKIATELDALQTHRVTVAQTKDTLVVQRAKHRAQQQKRVGKVNRRQERMAVLNGDIKGQRLTIRGLVSDRDARKRRLAQYHARIAHLQTVVDAAKRAEEDAVEGVADFQSWVDRSRASLMKNDAALAEAKKVDPSAEIPIPPVVPAGPSKASAKIDRLLAELQRERNDPGPSTAEATMMVEREQLIAQAAADEEATRILAAAKPAHAENEDEDATVMFSPDELRTRLEEETEEDETVVFTRPVPSKTNETE